MSLFDQLVNTALKNQPKLSNLRMVVEKELLHQDILRILSESGILKDLTFIGGTCLRSCYGGSRLSEDLDFTGGKDFSRHDFTHMAKTLTQSLNEKYGLIVSVKEPVKDINNVDTWKIKIETRPQQRDMPAQRINIDICRIPSYERQPMLLLNPYGIDMGTNGLVIQAQTLEEIYTDKLLAFALRPNRIKHRDLWDILWLHQKTIQPKMALIPLKLNDREISYDHFLELFQARTLMLNEDQSLAKEFNKEMSRFLPAAEYQRITEQEGIWLFIVHLMKDFSSKIT